jgi:hypothetical protein
MTKKRRAYATGTVMITVPAGDHDIHWITFSGRTYNKVCSGKPITIKGQGYHWDGEPDQDVWNFNTNEPGSIDVSTEGGGDIYSGRLDDGEVFVERGEPGSSEPSSWIV